LGQSDGSWKMTHANRRSAIRINTFMPPPRPHHRTHCPYLRSEVHIPSRVPTTSCGEGTTARIFLSPFTKENRGVPSQGRLRNFSKTRWSYLLQSWSVEVSDESGFPFVFPNLARKVRARSLSMGSLLLLPPSPTPTMSCARRSHASTAFSHPENVLCPP